MSNRETMEYDVVTVGAGPAGLAFAIRLKQLKPECRVCVIEKAATVGAHILSGAVIEPGPLDELIPQWREQHPPVCIPARSDEFYFLTKDKHFKLPTPPQMHNQGNFIVSLGALCAWLAPQAEALGVEIYPGFAASDVLFDDRGAVCGVRIGDMGVAKNGEHKPSYTQGIDIKAPITVLAEGARGHLSKKLIQHFDLARYADPQSYSVGIKELWQLPPGRSEPGKIIHTIGWPLDSASYGGSFLYHLDQDRIAIGYVTGLDYQDPKLMPFEVFQQFKHHPFIKPLLQDGTLISSGARALAAGGLQALPQLDMPGALLIGCAAGTLNVPKIKGTHQAMRSGMLAAEHIARTQSVVGFDAALRHSPVADELNKVRNIKPGFKKGLWLGLLNAAWETLTRGHSPWTLKNTIPDHAKLKKIGDFMTPERDWLERDLIPRDRLASVYFAATEHDEDQPIHLKILDPSICTTRCAIEYQNPCTQFCPAQVYEMVGENENRHLQINAANCVHCKTCDIKDPYQIINWVTPEGGSGPNYQNL
jgi:electron-transferring-flavoprotein dehydrogenase